jgi:hypothetical protein
MSPFRWIRSRRDAKLVALHTESLLARTASHVRAATVDRASVLSRSEARGYVRAKATTILTATIESLALQPAAAVPARLQPVVLRTAAERMTAAVLEQLVRTRPVSETRRRAA